MRSLLAIAGSAVALAFSGFLALPSSAAPAPLPAYPATITLNLGSQNCVTDDVIMNDPTTSPIADTYGSDGSPAVFSQATPPVIYYMWHLTSANVWALDPPPGVQVNPLTGVLSVDTTAATGPDNGGLALPGSNTYTVRDHGKDSLGAIGTEQFQVNVDDGIGGVSITYEGNDFDNANGALTIQLNASSTDSTALTLAAVPGSLSIPGSTPVTFSTVPPDAGWTVVGNVLKGVNASDPEIKATTANHDVVFFTLSGISTDSGGVFYTNNDVNPCVTGTPDVVDVTTPSAQTTVLGDSVSLPVGASATDGDSVMSYSATGLPAGLSINGSTGVISGAVTTSETTTVTVTATDNDESGSATFTWTVQNPATVVAPTSSYGDFLNPFLNGLDVLSQHFRVNGVIAVWPATQADPATHFIAQTLSDGNFEIQVAPNGTPDGLCVSNPDGGYVGDPGGPTGLVERDCNGSLFQQFRQNGPYLESMVNGQDVNPNGKGSQFTTGSPVPWGGSRLTWTPYAGLPV